MASISFSLAIFLTIIFFFTLKITPTTQTNEKETTLHFYYRERTKPPNATAIKIVSSPINQSIPIFAFGNILVFDDPITEDLDPTSRILGRVQGTIVIASLDGYDGLYTLNFVFNDMPPWTGSLLTVIGKNPTQKEIKELSVVGGTGLFRLARGYIVLRRLTPVDASDGVLIFEVNATVLY